MQGSKDWSTVNLERITRILLKQDHLTFFLKKAKQGMHEVRQEFDNVKEEKTALPLTVQLQTAKIRTLKAKIQFS